jgi:hypothetical protein
MRAHEIGQDTITTQSRMWHAIIVDYAVKGDKGTYDSAAM